MTTPAARSLEHGPVFSWYRSHGGWIHTSGHAAVDIDEHTFSHGDFECEAETTLRNLARTLQRARSSLDAMAKITAYMTDLNDFPRFNQF